MAKVKAFGAVTPEKPSKKPGEVHAFGEVTEEEPTGETVEVKAYGVTTLAHPEPGRPAAHYATKIVYPAAEPVAEDDGKPGPETPKPSRR